MLNYLSLKKDIQRIDELIESCENSYTISDSQLSNLKHLASKAAKGERSSIKNFISFLQDFKGINIDEYVKLVNSKGNLVAKQKDLLYQSSNAILTEDLQILLNFIISEIGSQYNIKFENSEELSNPSYWKYKFNNHKKVTQS